MTAAPVTVQDAPLDDVASAAAAAARPFAATEPRRRAQALVHAADALDGAAPELIATAMRETGLGEPRLQGELRRTSNQLRLFAEVIVEGAYLDARIDEADPDYVIGPRPDVRRVLQPVGPVLVFAASNFPFAFSVIGGDSAAALAAGCPVILKANPGHPELSAQTAALVVDSLAASGMPDGTFQIVSGQDLGVALLRDDRIRAGAFTGSTRVGRMLAEIAATRDVPIPFFGELGSVNPAYASPGAVENEPQLLSGFLASVSGSAGQLCTKPGFLFVPAGAELGDLSQFATTPEHRLLNPGIGSTFARRRDEVLEVPGVTVHLPGTVREDDGGQRFATPTVVEVTTEQLAANDILLEECFGPLSIIVRYRDAVELAPLHRRLFPGNLTSTLHATEAELESGEWSALITELAASSGRVLFAGWPTGVSVTSAMQHGGPYPATTTDSTSVGTAAIGRFMRAVAYQDAPAAALPPALRDDNPWKVPQRRSAAGLSSGWGRLDG
ncbi:MAG: aldehyde dehydrogenase (NADP(+)), partial [Leifsonia sp.]